MPLFLWLRAGAVGMPVLPLLSTLCFIYYAVPIIRHEVVAYDSEELLAAAATVGAFLIAASLACWPFYLHLPRRSPDRGRIFVSDRRIVQLALIGLCGGIAYHLGAVSGNLAWLSSFNGVVRALVVTLALSACYLVGYARASRFLVGPQWFAYLGCLLALITLAWCNLLLVGGLMYCAAALLGYVVTAKRIPWAAVAVTFAVLAVLHAGKFETRNEYWSLETSGLKDPSISQVPGMMADWVSNGLDALWAGDAWDSSDILERASLLQMVLLVRRETPDFVPFLNGETYRLLPRMIVPRFVEADKTISQAGLNLLSITYGLQREEATANTTIGWGLVAEGYANFGLWGVIGIGAIMGALCGALTRFSAGSSANSLPMLLTIAATLALMDVEADFSYLIVNLVQAVVAALALIGPLTLLYRPRPASGRRPVPADGPGPITAPR
ncbi:MAG TPA: hypothetical protein VGG57_08865 [Stellaceae bacterium]